MSKILLAETNQGTMLQGYRFLLGLIVGWMSINLSELLWSQSQFLEQIVPLDKLTHLLIVIMSEATTTRTTHSSQRVKA
jgi:hypothetical protein